MSRALGTCANKAMCAKTTTLSTERIEAAISASLKWLRNTRSWHFIVLSVAMTCLLVCLLEVASLCFWMLQAAFNALCDRADCISTPWLHFYHVTLPIIAFHVVTEYGPETPDPFSPLHFCPRPSTRGRKRLACKNSHTCHKMHHNWNRLHVKHVVNW